MDANVYNFYRSSIWDHRDLFDSLVGSDFFEQIENACLAIKKSLDNGGKVLIFGNGGSATEAEHFEAELVCKFEKERKALPAIALSKGSAILTAQSNDHHFISAFSRQVEALGNPGDIAVGITTSDITMGNLHSRNVQEAFIAARRKQMATMGLVSQRTKDLLPLIDYPIAIPHENTGVIQVAHRMIVHLLCKRIEAEL